MRGPHGDSGSLVELHAEYPGETRLLERGARAGPSLSAGGTGRLRSCPAMMTTDVLIFSLRASGDDEMGSRLSFWRRSGAGSRLQRRESAARAPRRSPQAAQGGGRRAGALGTRPGSPARVPDPLSAQAWFCPRSSGFRGAQAPVPDPLAGRGREGGEGHGELPSPRRPLLLARRPAPLPAKGLPAAVPREAGSQAARASPSLVTSLPCGHFDLHRPASVPSGFITGR